MTHIDSPFKMLISTFSEAFAEWLLGSPPQQVRPLNVELPASATVSDLVFEVVQANGEIVLLHIELQGHGSRQPMPWRMLDYMTRLVLRELGDRPPVSSIRLHSVIIYTGQGTGTNDTGRYEVAGLSGLPSLTWRYEPIRLWQMEAEELLALDEPAFLALIGQTRLREPERAVTEAVARIQQVADEVQRGRLLTALASLVTNEEAMKVVEKTLGSLDEYLLELPYQQHILQMGREEGLAKGREEGLAKGKEEGLTEGIAKGKEEGILAGLREVILETIALRFNPPAQEYRQVGQQLEDITCRETLHRLFVTAVQAEDMAAFASHLEEELSDQSDQ